MPLYHYVILRRDLPLGVIAAQTIHAAGESAAAYGKPIPKNTHAVALATPGEAELLALEQRLTEAGVTFVAIREPDAPWNGALMAIGLTPCDRGSVRPHLSNLPLLKEDEEKKR